MPMIFFIPSIMLFSIGLKMEHEGNYYSSFSHTGIVIIGKGLFVVQLWFEIIFFSLFKWNLPNPEVPPII